MIGRGGRSQRAAVLGSAVVTRFEGWSAAADDPQEGATPTRTSGEAELA